MSTTSPVALLVAFLCADPAVNLTVFGGLIISPDGSEIARFDTHSNAIKAIRLTREEIATRF